MLNYEERLNPLDKYIHLELVGVYRCMRSRLLALPPLRSPPPRTHSLALTSPRSLYFSLVDPRTRLRTCSRPPILAVLKERSVNVRARV